MNVTCFGASTLLRLYTCLTILLVTGYSRAQTPGNRASFRHLTTEDGLSGNRVRSFCHDRRGFLWIGAEDGLNRYDGKQCVAFRSAPGRAGALSGNTVPALLEDSRGNFWIGSNAGLQLLDQATGTFFPNLEDENPLRDIGHVLALKEDQNGHIWVGTTQGLFQLKVEPQRTFSPETFREARLPVRHFIHNPDDPSSLIHNHVWCIETDREGAVWVGTGRGLNRFDSKTGTFVRAPLPAVSNAHLLTNVAVSALLNDHAGNLWAGTKKGLYRVSPDRKTLRDLGNERYLQTGITRIIEDAQHHVWVGSDGGGLFRWTPNSDVPIRFSNEPDDPKSLKNNNIGALFADRDGGLWVGHHRGVSYRSRYQKPVAQYRATGQKNALAANNITSLFAGADGFVWMGGPRGISKFNPETRTFLGNVPTGSGCAADYTVSRTWRAQDLCGNTTTTTQVITVVVPAGFNPQHLVEEEKLGAETRNDAVRRVETRRYSVNPNPTTDRIWIDLSDYADEAVTVSIFGELGQLIWEKQIFVEADSTQVVRLREAGAKPGIYTLTARCAKGTVTKRVVLVD
jgi:ligand-binding sensor domain-containing protein